MKRWALTLLSLAACLPAPTELIGKACDPSHGCGPELLCVAGTCQTEPAAADAGTCGTGQESTCGDAIDDDCDGLVDCADPDCAQRSCGAASTAICCGAACVDLSTDARHCGGCSIACHAGSACVVATSGAITSGRCACQADPDCPRKNGGVISDNQSCDNDACTCEEDKECGTGQRCSADEGLSGPGFCHY